MGHSAQVSDWERYTATFPDRESVSGPGSTLKFTRGLRLWLPELFGRYEIRSILDAPCGDGNWLSRVDLRGKDYLGWDIQPGIVADNIRRYGPYFQCVNLLTKRVIPAADLILCRDLFAHLTDEQITKVLTKFRRSGSRFLLATTFGGDNTFDSDTDADGFPYRPINLCVNPFSLPEPLEAIDEPGPEVGRRMALWALC